VARLWDVATALLNATTAAFATSAAPPAVSYVADGAITLDFGAEDAIVVTWDRLRPSLALAGASDRIVSGYATTGEFSLYVLRIAPGVDDAGNPPATAALAAAAQVMLDDAWLAVSTIIAGLDAGTLLGPCGDAVVLDQSPVGPEGGVEGSRLRLAVSLA